MGKKTSVTPKLKETSKLLKNKATDLNKELFHISEELIEGGIHNGHRIQDILEKVLKNSTHLLGKQQELTLDTIEAIVEQYKTSKVRFKKLLGSDQGKAKQTSKTSKTKPTVKEQSKKRKLFAKKTEDKKTTTIDELMEMAFQSEN